MFNATFENSCSVPGPCLDDIQKLEDTKFSKKRDAKFKRDGIKPKTPIDSTEDTGEEDAYTTFQKENESRIPGVCGVTLIFKPFGTLFTEM
jgi:hypothetical protein